MSFREVPATKRALALRRKVYGVGTNDAPYMIEYRTGDRRVPCPFYKKWAAILERCYAGRGRYPSYEDCRVCDEWLTFSAFKAWAEQQPWQGREIDKDLKVLGNRIYSPETCLFVPKLVNSVILDNASRRGALPRGVSRTPTGRLFAQLQTVDGHKHLGYFDGTEQAARAYVEAKTEEIQKLKARFPDLADVLDGYAEHLTRTL